MTKTTNKSMNLLKKYSTLMLILVSFGLGLGINFSKITGGVPSCIESPVCQDEKLGTLTTETYGFPLAYKEVVTFEPNDTSSFASASIERQGFSWPRLFVNAVFWYALLGLGLNTYTSLKKRT